MLIIEVVLHESVENIITF